MKNRKRALSTLVTACMVAGTLAGCGNAALTASGTTTAADKGGKSDGVTELTYWYCWNDKVQENNLEMTELFNETVGKEKGIM